MSLDFPLSQVSQQGLGGQGKRNIYFRGTRKQRQHLRGTRGTKTILGNRKHKKTSLGFGEQEEKSMFQGNKSTSIPMEGPYKFKGHRLEVKLYYISSTKDCSCLIKQCR